jgi:hypothetical protein
MVRVVVVTSDAGTAGLTRAEEVDTVQGGEPRDATMTIALLLDVCAGRDRPAIPSKPRCESQGIEVRRGEQRQERSTSDAMRDTGPAAHGDAQPVLASSRHMMLPSLSLNHAALPMPSIFATSPSHVTLGMS